MTKLHNYRHRKAKKVIAIKKNTHTMFIDRLIYLAAIIEPLFSLPQAYQIYHDKAAANVSVLSWMGFEIMALIWIWYGIAHKEKMILIYQGMFLIIDGSVLIGAIYYGGKLF